MRARTKRNLALAAIIFLAFIFLTSMIFPKIVNEEEEFNYSPRIVETQEKEDISVKIFGSPDLAQDSDEIIDYLHMFHLTPPSTKPYNLNPVHEHPSEFFYIIRRIFKNKRNGFFIEAGANDGEMLSNTLDLEKNFNWRGLLIEPNQFMLVKLRLKERKAWLADVCLSQTPMKVRMMHAYTNNKRLWAWNGGGVIKEELKVPKEPSDGEYIFAGMAECFPLYSILSAINKTVVDYFSLDVEGFEYKVLAAIPWDLVTIKVMSIEVNLIPEGEGVLTEYLKSKNYVPVLRAVNELFVIHKDYLITSIFTVISDKGSQISPLYKHLNLLILFVSI